MKIRPVGAELFYADGQTTADRRIDMTTLIVIFRNFSNAPKYSVRTSQWIDSLHYQQNSVNDSW